MDCAAEDQAGAKHLKWGGAARHLQKSVTSQAQGMSCSGGNLQQVAFHGGSSRGSSTQQLRHPKRVGPNSWQRELAGQSS